MSDATSNLLPSLTTGVEKNVLWVDTHYFDLKPNTIANMRCNVVWNSGKINLKYYDIVIEFRFTRTDQMRYKFTCSRIPVSLPPANYILELHCSINIFDQDPDVLILLSDQQKVGQTYDLNSCCISSKCYKTELELKILVKMVEYDCDSSLAFTMQEEELSRKQKQEDEFRKVKENSFNDETVLSDLLYILNIPEVEDIFTGRQIDEFAKLRTLYITRTASFSKNIIKYMMAKNARNPVSSAELGIILNHILNGVDKQIDYQDLFKVYLEAHRMGLNFLVDLSRDAILDKIFNQSFMFEALVVADRVGDKVMFKKVAEIFYSCNKTEQFNLDFQERVKIFGEHGRFMIQSLARQLRKIKENKESEGCVETGESSHNQILQNDLFTSAVTFDNV